MCVGQLMAGATNECWPTNPPPSPISFPTAPTPELPDEPEVTVVTSSDIAHLLVEEATVRLVPDQDWVVLNYETIAYTDAEEHELSTTILETPITVQVSPTVYHWDFHDPHQESLYTTEDPGAPYPDHTVGHTYIRSASDLHVSLTVEWEAQWRLDSENAWQPVLGELTTTGTSHDFEAREFTTRLVDH